VAGPSASPPEGIVDDMLPFYHLVTSHEDWLMARVLEYAKRQNYVKYTSTLIEAWRVSISGLTGALVLLMQQTGEPPELGPDDDYTADPSAAFGIVEAERHRGRGITVAMFLGLMKYYRQSYLDLVSESALSGDEKTRALLFIRRFFDRVELGFTSQWCSQSDSEALAELRSANRAMTNEKNRYLTVFESIPDPVFLFDEHDTPISANHAAMLLSSTSAQPGRAHYPADAAAPAPYPQWLAGLLDCGSREENVAAEREVRIQDEARWFEIRCMRMLDISSKFAGRILILKDITERKQTRDELQESRMELQHNHEALNRLFKVVSQGKREWELSMDCIDDIVILADAEGRIKRCNKPLLDFMGKTYAACIGRLWKQLLIECGLAIADYTAGTLEILHPGRNRWYLIRSYPVQDETGGSPAGSVITIEETTEIKRKNRELETAYSELKTTQARILQQEKMASIGQLAAGVAHEINNPLGFIASNLGTLNKYINRVAEYTGTLTGVLSSIQDDGALKTIEETRKKLKIDFIMEDAKKLVNESLDGAGRVKTIVQGLKSFSRVDDVECKLADINECLDSTINIVWNELKYKATLNKDYGELPLVKCNPQQLNQVFMNLLVNASQSIADRGAITIKTRRENGSICISITDTGSGIPAENLARIFEPFFTTKPVGKGTGLGLSITFDIVKKHNGDITVESEVGKGTTFFVRIPVQS
jgi:two-component system, NtrC family, sensor kinase